MRLLVEEIHNFELQDKAADTVKLLIPQQFVAKIIGTGTLQCYLGGNMIREISAGSGGAQVVVLSDKENEQATDEIAVLITGTKEMKVEAASLVTEKIATFRYMVKVLEGTT